MNQSTLFVGPLFLIIVWLKNWYWIKSWPRNWTKSNWITQRFTSLVSTIVQMNQVIFCSPTKQTSKWYMMSHLPTAHQLSIWQYFLCDTLKKKKRQCSTSKLNTFLSVLNSHRNKKCLQLQHSIFNDSLIVSMKKSTRPDVRCNRPLVYSCCSKPVYINAKRKPKTAYYSIRQL